MTDCEATGRNLETVEISPQESTMAGLIRRMAEMKDPLIPIMMAARQYWEFYGGMGAAAAFEDLWFEGLEDTVSRLGCSATIVKTPRGADAAGGDYVLDDQPFSHKTTSGKSDIAVLWDSLIAQHSNDDWDSPTPMVFARLGYGKKTWKWIDPSGEELVFQPIWWGRDLNLRADRTPYLIHWAPDGKAKIISELPKELLIESTWTSVSAAVGIGHPLNELEIMTVAVADQPSETGMMDASRRAGFSVLPRDLLQGVPMSQNNRGLLVKSATLDLLADSSNYLGLLIPTPLWPLVFASSSAQSSLAVQRAFCEDYLPALHICR